jgi:hypothetical protein
MRFKFSASRSAPWLGEQSGHEQVRDPSALGDLRERVTVQPLVKVGAEGTDRQSFGRRLEPQRARRCDPIIGDLALDPVDQGDGG